MRNGERIQLAPTADNDGTNACKDAAELRHACDNSELI